MAKVAPSLLAVGSGAAFTAQPSPRKGASLFRDRVISRRARISAKLGGDGELKPPGKKKFITRDEEEGENPMKTPLPYIIIFGMSTPFVILAIAFANGWIKVPVR
ncbi:hypothetical protein PVAP13_9NG672642 [Panicum virgatum]|uniref:Uncharacterized protein n=1 Tax=Panicum virgatum TaxID=38727 RepID=A0A8T0N4T1_PANVG|nr:hypothetical protein PVAP13_9NG672642 [Panicum virgatum]